MMKQPIDSVPESPTSNPSKTHVRITSHGKMKSWVAFSLTFFEDSEDDKTLVLHTLPAILKDQPDSGPSPDVQPIPHRTASATTSAVPRLISVAEIIKREYIKNLEKTRSSRPIGLHQYNEIGTLEELGIVVGPPVKDGEPTTADNVENARANQILHALGGQNHPRQTQTPFMRVTLSTVELPVLLSQGAHYQHPIVRKFSKSAKARAKKRAKANAKQPIAETMSS